jgi:hypothetical protein
LVRKEQSTAFLEGMKLALNGFTAVITPTAVITAVNPFSARFMPSKKWGAAAALFGEGHLQAELPMFEKLVILRFSKCRACR